MGIKDIQETISNKKRVKTVGERFQEQLNEAIVKSNERRKPSKTYKPSSLGGCMRNMYYQVVGEGMDEDKGESPDLIGIGESGTDRHIRIQNHIANMKKLGYNVEWVPVDVYLNNNPQPGVRIVSREGMETKLAHDGFNMSFMCDGIIRFEGVYYILEIKTEASFKFQGRVQPEDKHITQASCYALTLDIDRIMFIYENRDVCSKKVFEYEVTDEDKASRVLAEIDTCESFRELEQVPPMTTKKRECTYCKYKKKCKEDGND